MHNDYENLFAHLKIPEPSQDLFDKVVRRVKKERHLLPKIIFFAFGLIGSIAAFIPAIITFHSGLSESGFFQFSSLLFSDMGIVMTHWQNFLLTLLESLPILNLALLLTIVLVFLGSLKFLAEHVHFFPTRKLLTHF